VSDLPSLNTGVAHPARICDYWLGGHNHFKADREAAELAIAANPMIVLDVRANRRFLARIVSYLIEDAGIRQFLDIGSGLPTEPNIHEVAQSLAPESRVVYVDNDPVVSRHAHTLLASDRTGTTQFVLADFRQSHGILAHAMHTLDLDQPVALILSLVLHLIPPEDHPRDLLAALLRPLPPGSHVVIAYPASDVRSAAVAEMTRRLNERMGGVRGTPCARAEVAKFFDDVELLEPGIVQPQRWRPTGPITGAEVPIWVGVGRKP
jgi:O-methyltransferase involved in polyketide biosynthesis